MRNLKNEVEIIPSGKKSENYEILIKDTSGVILKTWSQRMGLMVN